MNKDPYSILGVSQNASDEEVKNAYRALARKYHPDNYDSENPLKDLANEKMQEINWAYDEIQRIRHEGGNMYSGNGTYYQNSGAGSSSSAKDPIYIQIRTDINARRFADAERALLGIQSYDRIAEWHYLMSLVLMARKNPADAMRELEIACNMEPSNFEYQKAKEMFNANNNAYGNTYYGSSANYNRRMRSRSDDACDCCANLICLDCLCECMGGDLISCC